LNRSFGLVLSERSQSIEMTGIAKEFVACFAEPRLSGQILKDFSYSDIPPPLWQDM